MTIPLPFHYHLGVTGAQVKRIQKALGLIQQQFADRLGVHKVTVAKWETDAQGMRSPAARLIALLGQSIKARLFRPPKFQSANPPRPKRQRKVRRKTQ